MKFTTIYQCRWQGGSVADGGTIAPADAQFIQSFRSFWRLTALDHDADKLSTHHFYESSSPHQAPDHHNLVSSCGQAVSPAIGLQPQQKDEAPAPAPFCASLRPVCARVILSNDWLKSVRSGASLAPPNWKHCRSGMWDVQLRRSVARIWRTSEPSMDLPRLPAMLKAGAMSQYHGHGYAPVDWLGPKGCCACNEPTVDAEFVIVRHWSAAGRAAFDDAPPMTLSHTRTKPYRWHGDVFSYTTHMACQVNMAYSLVFQRELFLHRPVCSVAVGRIGLPRRICLHGLAHR